MRYLESGPAPLLIKYIKLFWSLEYDPAGDGDIETVLPDGCPEIVFNLSDRFRRVLDSLDVVQPATLFAGQMSRSISIRPSGKVQLFGVRFHPSGAHPLIGLSMRDLNDEIFDIKELIGGDGWELEEKIHLAGSFRERAGIFEKFFVRKLVSARPDRAAAGAVEFIIKSKGSISVAALADRVGLSERSLQRSFYRDVGLSPKMLSRVVRFQALIGRIQKAKTPGSLDAALEMGYFDQSHAIRDFREFSGTTPLGYSRTTHGLSDLFTGASEGLNRKL